MLRALCSAAAREKRATDCTLYVDADNEPAVRLYASEGFVVESRLESGFTLNFAGKIGPAWTNLMECMRSEPGEEPTTPYVVVTDPDRYLRVTTFTPPK
ncbi:hypothetical protein H632_c2041p1 [Helicosporidium sp. ATCC 50920]|nr:hypothetical protein H632_c2041p1 [Helicosporidium sp. ATCC 50920]|eukprot:KDD73576.1 hypothetical protein H632_c2041p1 [Helicosporidium sp. ATCC 50920]